MTARGREQVRTAGAWIAQASRPTHVLTSPYQRARQSADILADMLGVPVEIDRDLRERSYGVLAGEPYDRLRSAADYDPSVYWEWRPPGGETLVEVEARVGPALDRVVHGAPDDDVVVVSHAAVLMALWHHVTGAWRGGRVVPNAGIVLVEHRGAHYVDARIVELPPPA